MQVESSVGPWSLAVKGRDTIAIAGERGDMDELRCLADKGNISAAEQLMELAE